MKMAAHSNLAYFAGITARRRFMAPDKGGTTGSPATEETPAPDASEGGTLKAQLSQAHAKISDLEAKVKESDSLQAKIDALNGQLSAANSAKDAAEQAKADALAKVSALEGEKAQLSAKVSDLEKNRERLSAANLNPGTTKDTPATTDADAGDPIALWESYAAADSIEKAALRAKHGAKLAVAAAAYDAAQKKA